MSVRNTATVIVLVLGVLACSRDQDTPPQDDTTGAPSDSSGPEPSTTLTATTVDPDSTGTVEGSSGASESGTTGEGECIGPGGCYACDPQSSAQLLDHCTDADCAPFDNSSARLPLIRRDGTLPPIP